LLQDGGSFSEDRPPGWDPVAVGNRAGDGMARTVSEEKASAGLPPLDILVNLRYTYYISAFYPLFV